MRYLITGAQGFVGRFLCSLILRTDPDATIVGIGRSAPRTTFTHEITWQGRRRAAPLTADLRELDRARYRYLACDLRTGVDLDRVVADSAPDAVIHLAAALRDDAAGELVRSNVDATQALIRSLAGLSLHPRLIVGSSGSVYGAPTRLPVSEDQRCAPVEPYAMSKLAAELVGTVLAADAAIPTIIARIFNIAGPGQDERHVCGRFAAQAAAIAYGDAEPIFEIGDLRPTRDFIDVRDVARALVVLVHDGTPGETYNVASGVETAIADVLALTLETANLSRTVTTVGGYERAADISRAYADITKLQQCGFEPAFPLRATIADLLAYYVRDVAVGTTGATISERRSSLTAAPRNQG